MSQHSDAIKAMRGELPASIPFIGRMNLWYNYHKAAGTLPQRYAGWSLWDIQRDLHIGIFGFGAWMTTFFKKVYRDLEVREYTENEQLVTEYSTPYGTLRKRYAVTDLLQGIVDSGRYLEDLFKDERDYDALRYLVEHTEIVENYDEYADFVDSIGQDGVALPFTGWAPMHDIMLNYMGVERFFYELHDHPTKVEDLHAALREQHLKIAQLAAHCPAQAIEVGGNYTEQLTPPRFFERYITPFYQDVLRVFEGTGKIVVTHGDGDMRKLLRCLMDAGIQVVEAITPKPDTSIDIRETRQLWAGKVTLWGGVPFSVLTPAFSDEEFMAQIEDLYRSVAPGDRFILGFGDNVPPEALFHRIQWLARFSEAHSAYPIRV
jgi:hypothetical protein